MGVSTFTTKDNSQQYKRVVMWRQNYECGHLAD